MAAGPAWSPTWHKLPRPAVPGTPTTRQRMGILSHTGAKISGHMGATLLCVRPSRASRAPNIVCPLGCPWGTFSSLAGVEQDFLLCLSQQQPTDGAHEKPKFHLVVSVAKTGRSPEVQAWGAGD